MDFVEWMQRTGVKPSTINHYKGAIYGTLSRLVGVPIYEVDQPEEFENLMNDLVMTNTFRELNEVGHRMYSSALEKYRKFLMDNDTALPAICLDINRIKADKLVTKTQQLALINARVGQGNYRKALLELWDGHCSVTSFDDSRMLVASHIKPWALSDNMERLDPQNGLLLTPALDRAFDIGLISFDPKTHLIVFSNSFVSFEKLGLHHEMKLSHCSESTAKYLRFHKKNVLIHCSF